MIEYLGLLDKVLTKGVYKKGPQVIGAYTLYGEQIKYDLREGFPLLTVRDLSGKPWRAAVAELLWILSGSTNAHDLHKYGVKLWDRWATAETSGKLGYTDGEMGPVYGHQLRNFNNKIDQLTRVLNMFKRNVNTRRGVITYWNLDDVEDDEGNEKVFVAPCPTQLNFFHQEGKLGLHMTQRSADACAGIPFDVAEYSLLLMLMARELNLEPWIFIHSMTEIQIYTSQEPAVREMLKRTPRSRPTVTLTENSRGVLFDKGVQHPELLDGFILSNYDPHPFIPVPVPT